MLIRPMPLPDELDRGYQGRLMRINGKKTPQEIMTMAAIWAELGGKSWREVSTVEILSKVAGMNTCSFVCQHTTLPLRRGITSYLPDLPHGHESSRSMLWSSALRSARSFSYFCQECVAEDLDFHGVSYWRRGLQTPGLLWCTKHGVPLNYVETDNAFYLPPSAFLANSRVVDTPWVTELQEDLALQRFLSISSGLMDRDTPLDVKDVCCALKMRAVAKGLRTYGGKGKDPLLSDLTLNTFNAAWLAMVFPALLKKPPGEVLNRLDGVLYLSTSASSTTAYILAAVVLFDTADEALNALNTAQTKAQEQPRRLKRTIELDDGELCAAYVANSGNHGAVAIKMHERRQPVAIKLATLGLPNLFDKDGDALAFVHAFLVDGKSLADAKIASGISKRTMEYILRTIGASFTHVIRAIDDAAQTGKSKVRKLRSLPPHEAYSNG